MKVELRDRVDQMCIRDRPLAQLPEVTPLPAAVAEEAVVAEDEVVIADEEVPLAQMIGEEFIIEDTQTPLRSAPPRTGKESHASAFAWMLAGLAGLGLGFELKKGKHFKKES